MSSPWNRTAGKQCLIMGILNLSPDSFYADSRCGGVDAVSRQAERLLAEGADILDVGAESSRPGSKPISVEEEAERLIPAVATLVRRFGAPVSVDTYKPPVAEQALAAGAAIVNDITGLQTYPEMAPLIARFKAGVVVMHKKGDPENMQDDPRYEDVIGEISGFFARSIRIAEDAGIPPDRVALDPGIGFGKNLEHNLEVINNLDVFEKFGRPLLLGVSRKSFIGEILNEPVEERLEGSLTAAVIGMLKGAAILRVHDVRATARAVRTAQAILAQSVKGGRNGKTVR